ncbi:MAG: guanylate kinase [Chloroflexi bacterium]|nr:guanylate kinase [Chloroflexota bacterium]
MKNHLFVLSGPSGVGKDAVLEQLRGLGVPFTSVVTCTTRERRPGEVHGVDYLFVSEETFDEMQRRGEFLEVAEIYGHRYGTPVEAVRRALRAQRDLVLKIDVQGARQVRERVPGAVLVFLAPARLDDLTARLRDRQTEPPEAIAGRLREANREMAEVPHYDYLIVNREGRPVEAAAQLRCIMEAEKRRVAPRRRDAA